MTEVVLTNSNRLQLDIKLGFGLDIGDTLMVRRIAGDDDVYRVALPSGEEFVYRSKRYELRAWFKEAP